jgi:DNA-binding NtrC family response regulator
MSSVSLPVQRGGGRALVVASPSNRPATIAILQQLGLSCSEVEDPYAAALELARRPLVYRALILSLASLFKEELSLISCVKRRNPHVEIWLTHTEGRVAALAEAMRQGADGLLSEEGLHRTAMGAPAEPLAPSREATEQQSPQSAHEADEEDLLMPHEPVLSADELRALLHEQPDQE